MTSSNSSAADNSHAVKTSVSLEGEDIHWKPDLSYKSYLSLDGLLAAQNPLSDDHDEMLFIIIHQASELWMKACLHELKAAIELIANDQLGPAFKMIARIARIQTNLQQSWEILSTLTPADYNRFRPKLGQSSGFQSAQYRELEYRLGNKNARMAETFKDTPEDYDQLQQVLDTPGIYDQSLMALARHGLAIPDDKLDRDWRQPYQACERVEDAWLEVYRAPETYWTLYELAEKLVDLEMGVQKWRYAHLKTVERIIGFKAGTGGTSGAHYLKRALDLKFFPELWTARTRLV